MESWNQFVGDMAYESQISSIVLEDQANAREILDSVLATPAVNELHVDDQPYWYSYLYADLGDTTRARELVNKALANWTTVDDVASIPMTEAILLSRHGRIDEAMPKFDEALRKSSCDTCGWILFRRGIVLDQAGRLEEAIGDYLRIVDTPAAERVYDDGLYLAPTLLRLADAYERTGQPDEAIKYYTWFCDLWKDADPAMRPRVAEAQANLDRLLLASARE